MCDFRFNLEGQRKWILGEDEIPTRPVLRHSSYHVHCGFHMAVTETHLHCRAVGCHYSIWRWAPPAPHPYPTMKYHLGRNLLKADGSLVWEPWK